VAGGDLWRPCSTGEEEGGSPAGKFWRRTRNDDAHRVGVGGAVVLLEFQ
jgi:hypothetical protein